MGLDYAQWYKLIGWPASNEGAPGTVAIVPARRGSRGVVNKNFRPFAGTRDSLTDLAQYIGWATCERTFVSTDYIANEGPTDREIPRPQELARDDTPMLEVVQHAVKWLGKERAVVPDVVVLLQPTSPLRKPEHVREALRLLEETGADSVVSVVEIPAHYSPDFACKIDGYRLRHFLDERYEHGGLVVDLGQYTRRQDCRKAYSRDGTVYVTRREVIEAGSLYGDKCVPLIIPPHESANIDTEEDWQRAEAIMKARLAG